MCSLSGHKVLLLEHHYSLVARHFVYSQGRAYFRYIPAWFPERDDQVVSQYWTKEISDSIVPLKDIRFVNPQMTSDDVHSGTTMRVLIEQFNSTANGGKFYDHLRAMNFYDNNPETTRELFNRSAP